jgi:hypothetical protein
VEVGLDCNTCATFPPTASINLQYEHKTLDMSQPKSSFLAKAKSKLKPSVSTGSDAGSVGPDGPASVLPVRSAKESGSLSRQIKQTVKQSTAALGSMLSSQSQTGAAVMVASTSKTLLDLSMDSRPNLH